MNIRKSNSQDKSAKLSFSSSSDEEERPKNKTTRTMQEYQVTQVTRKPHASTGLDLVTLPIQEAKSGKMSFLLDTEATLTLMKVGTLKSDTQMREERLALTEVTGHKIYILGKIRATMNLGGRNMRHSIYVVKDDFPIDYDGILRIDFLKKQRAKVRYALAT